MTNVCPPHYDMTAEKEWRRALVAKSLQPLIVLVSEVDGKTHGYGFMKESENLFKVKPRHLILYSQLEKLREKGILKQRIVSKNGRLRKEYTPNEPQASMFLKPFFRAESEFHSGIEKLRERLERNDSSVQIGVILPEDEGIRVAEWTRRYHAYEKSKHYN